MKRFGLLLFLPVLALPALLFQQNGATVAPAELEITGVNAADAPVVTVAVSVTDSAGQAIPGLGLENFQLGGPLADLAEIVSAESITEDNLPFAVVLVIDTSASMVGTPLQRTQEAAKAFVNSLGPDDPVALVTFSNDPHVLREFTTDKADIIAAIDNLRTGGRTALYDAAVAGVELAAEAPYSRRAVILLSDGAEYGGASVSPRSAGRELSQVRGVPVYTIGLGFGLDRTYLQELSEASSARFTESPAPEQLAQVYDDLAALFRSQYVLTLNYTGPLDGRIVAFTLRAENETGQSAFDAATMRAPIPVPVVRVSPMPTAPMAEAVTFTATVVADQPVSQVEFILNGGEPVALTDEPYEFAFDPFVLAPGNYTLQVRAADEDGDVGIADVPLTVAAIPARIVIDTDISLDEPIAVPVIFSVQAEAQTALQSIEFRVDGETIDSAAEESAEFNFDPLLFPPGAHTVEFVVTDASGAQAASTTSVEVAALPPTLTVDSSAITGVLTEDTVISAEAGGQTPITDIAFTLNAAALGFADTPTAEFTIRPLQIAPGPQRLVVIATNAAGLSTAQAVDFEVAILPPVVEITGLAEGDTIADPTHVSVEVLGQSPEAVVTMTLNGNVVEGVNAAPYVFTLDPLVQVSGPGEYAVTFDVTNSFGGQTAVVVNIIVPESLFPTATPPPSATPDATQTAEALSALALGTANAQATADAGATVQAQETESFRATSEARATADAEATALIVEALTQEADVTHAAETQEALSTLNAEATAQAVESQQAQATLDAQATADALITAEAQSTLDAQSTADALLTRTVAADRAAQRLATAEAQSTLDTQATIDAERTEIAQVTLDAEATADARAAETQAASTATESARAEQAQAVQATADADSTREAATSEAATLVAQVALTETASVPTETPTEEPTATPTEEPTEEPSETPTEAPTEEPTTEPTEVVEATPTVFDPTSTPSSLTDVVAEGAQAPDTSVAVLAMAAGIGLLLLIIFLVLSARRRQ